MKAIAYINSDIYDMEHPLYRPNEEQEHSIVNYCIEYDINLFEVFKDDRLGWSLINLEAYLFLKVKSIDVIIVNCFDSLEERYKDISDRLLLICQRYNLKLVCLYQSFIKKICNEINEFSIKDEHKKQVAELAIKYLLPFRRQTITFKIKDLADFYGVNRKDFLTPFTPYENPFYLEDLSGNFFPPIRNDRFLQMSLIEASLTMLNTQYLILYTVGEDGKLSMSNKVEIFTITYFVVRPEYQYKFLVKELTVTFSDEFWNYFETYT